MMADSAFGDSLFEEFDRETQASDRILRSKFINDEEEDSDNNIDGEDSEEIESDVSSSDSENGDLNGDADVKSSIGRIVSDKNRKSRQHNSNQLCDNNGIAAWKKKYWALRSEQKRLRKMCHLVSEKVKDQEGPAIQVIYMNHKVSRKYRAEIEAFLGELISRERSDGRQLPNFQERRNAVNITMDGAKGMPPKERSRQTRACTAIGCSQLYNEFILDSMGWPLVNYNTSLTDGWEVPYYDQWYKNTLPCDPEEEEDEGLKRPSRPKASCFNCGEEHNLAECKAPRDHARINKNRNEFRAASSHTMKRYTMDSMSSKYDAFKPGTISKELRNAIGISSHQLPPYIYQMRHYGYPPGWLKEAEVVTSGISLFDKHGKQVAEEGEAASEEGEVDTGDKKMMDPTKLVEYPGFNVQLDKNTRDESEKFNMPPMQPNQQIDVLRAYLSQVYEFSSGQKRKHGGKRDEGESSSKKSRWDAGSDMDVSIGASPMLIRGSLDSQSGSNSPATHQGNSQSKQRRLDMNAPPLPPTPDRPPLPKGTPPVTPGTPHAPPLPPTPDQPPLPIGTPPVTPCTPTDGVFKTPHGITPLSTSVSQNEATPLDSGTTPNSDDIATKLRELRNESGSQDTSEDDTQDIGMDEGEVDMTSCPSTPASIPLSRCSSLSKSFGTPVMEGQTPSSEGKQLPNAQKFADGITEHLPFENLPNSTGRFQDLKKLLDFARKSRKDSS